MGPVSFTVQSPLAYTLMVVLGSLSAMAFGSPMDQADWTRMIEYDHRSIYSSRNGQDNEMVILQVVQIAKFPNQFGDVLNSKEITGVRAKLFNMYGLTGYTLLNSTRFKDYLTTESVFKDLKNQKVSMVERYYRSGPLNYYLAYVTDQAAIHDRARVDKILDSFQSHFFSEHPGPPKKPFSRFGLYGGSIIPEAEAQPPSDVVEGSNGIFRDEQEPNSLENASADSPPRDSKLTESEIGKQCNGVKNEERRSPSDFGFFEEARMHPGDTALSCLGGINPIDWIKAPINATISYLKAEKAYFKCSFSSECRNQVDSAAGIIASQISKDPASFARNALKETFNAIRNYVGCLKPEVQWAKVCSAASLLIPGGLLFKLAGRVPLTIDESSRLAKIAASVVRDTLKPMKEALVARGSSDKASLAFGGMESAGESSRASALAEVGGTDRGTIELSSSQNMTEDIPDLKLAPERVSKKLKEYEDNALKSVRSPAVDAGVLRKRVEDVWNNPDLSVKEKAERTFDEYFQMRISEMPPDRQDLARTARERIDDTKKNDPGYWPKKGKLLMGAAISQEDIAYWQTLSHELEHLDQFGGGPGKVPGRLPKNIEKAHLSTLERFMDQITMMKVTNAKVKGMLMVEPEAIGAQWDYLQAIPREARLEAARRIMKNQDLSPSLKATFRSDLLSADLSRDEFIRKVTSLHGYTFANRAVQNSEMINHAFQTVLFGELAFGICAKNSACTNKIAPYMPSWNPE